MMGFFPLVKVPRWLVNSEGETVSQRAAVLLCAFGSTALQISGLAWDLEQLEMKTVSCSIANHLHLKIFMYVPETTEEI